MVLNKPYSSSMEKEIQKAANIINAFFDSRVDADSAIPVELVRNCAGLAFLTVVKAGLIWTGKLGTGVVIARMEDGSWSPPSGIGTAGVGFGAEIGGEIIDFMIVLGSESALATFKKGTQVSIGAGLDLAVGPVGRAAGASMNAGSGGLSGNFTYSHAKGIFAGVGLHGSTIMVRGDMNRKFYGRDVTPMEILNGHVQPPAGTCDSLYEAIRRVSSNDTAGTAPGSYPVYGSYGQGSSARSLNHSASSSSSNSRGSFSTGPTTATSSSSSRSSFDQQRSSAHAAPTTVAPPADDLRLRRYSSYKSERELYAQFSQQKSAPQPAATSYATNTSGGYAAAPSSGYAANNGGYAGAPAAAAAGGYAASASYNQYASAPVQQPPVQTGSAPSTHVHPTNPALKYTSYPAPSASSTYVQPQPTYSSSSYASTPAPAPVQHHAQQVPPLPSAAIGAETKEVYTQVMNFITTRCPYANLQTFKDNCRLFGQDAMSLDAFYSYISSICSKQLLKELVPQLVRLLPTQDKRERLWTMYCRDVLLLKVVIIMRVGHEKTRLRHTKMAMILTQEEIDACRESFVHFDKDGSGTIDKYELSKVLEAMGQKPTDEELFQMIAEVDNDNSGEIEFSEFLKVIEAQKLRAAQFDDESDFIDAFVACGGNPDKSGHVERRMLVQLIKKDFGLPIDIDRMLDELDTDGSGEIEYDEFKALLS
uniref:EF-hand domain-containing protein n=1 Tax=Globisporangium ultimum (strain ATCC 200006 / CBS 805.95 / DAOM BR144) TaxID=431595 RepID=K3WU82_GLOUD